MVFVGGARNDPAWYEARRKKQYEGQRKWRKTNQRYKEYQRAYSRAYYRARLKAKRRAESTVATKSGALEAQTPAE